MNNSNGIQIIGTQRSGSNLLRVMLEQSDDITAPHPPHVLQHFVPLMHHYAPLDDSNYYELVEDVLSFIRFNPVPWENIPLNATDIINRTGHYSIYGLFGAIYEEAAKRRNSKYWCCKSMANYKYYRELENCGIRPKYVYLYRDGRDVAVSFKKAIVGEKHIYHLAKQWDADQRACLQLAKALGPQRCLILKYENLIANTEEVVSAVCDFLQIDFTDRMLHYYMSQESMVTASSGAMWSNLTKPVLKDNHHKFLRELSETEIGIFEVVAGDTLKALGYQLHTNGSRAELLSPALTRRYDSENNSLKEAVRNRNAADFNTRNGQRMVLENVKNRTAQRKIIL